MKRLPAFLSLFLLPLMLTSQPAATAAQQSDGIFPFEYEKVALENGFSAYLIDAGAPGQLAYVAMVRTGSRDEVEEGKTGFAHFFEHMMFRGTEKYPNYDAEVAKFGASRNAFTTPRTTPSTGSRTPATSGASGPPWPTSPGTR